MKWIKRVKFPVPIMLATGISMQGKLFIVGGVTGSAKKLQPISDVFVLDEFAHEWKVWTTMSESRLNHSTVQYGNYLIISGGHTLQEMSPREVKPSITFNINDSECKEFLTPLLGSHKLGMGMVMIGDVNVLNKVRNSSGSIVSSPNCSSLENGEESTNNSSSREAKAFMSLIGCHQSYST